MFSDDGISGGEFRNRPGLNRLLETIKAKPHTLNALVVSEQSRLGRDTIRSLALLQTLNDAGTQVWSYLEGKELSTQTRSSRCRLPHRLTWTSLGKQGPPSIAPQQTIVSAGVHLH